MNKTLLSIALFGALGFATASQAVIIDDFNNPGAGQVAEDNTVNGSGESSTTNPLSGPFDNRELRANLATGSGGSVLTDVNASIGGVLKVTTTPQETGTSTVNWFGVTTTPLDLTAGGADTLELIYNSSSANASSIALTITLHTDIVSSSDWTANLLASATSGTPLSIPFSAFAQSSGKANPVDLTNIDSISLQFTLPSDSFAEFDLIQTTTASAAAPIPSSLALLGLGLIGMRRFRRRA